LFTKVETRDAQIRRQNASNHAHIKIKKFFWGLYLRAPSTEDSAPVQEEERGNWRKDKDRNGGEWVKRKGGGGDDGRGKGRL